MRVSEINLDHLFYVCQKHILTACVSYALESVGVKHHEFIQAKEKAIRKNILLDAERKKILNRLEQEQIWYMPLKGSLLKELYPKLGMRQMADNDILFNDDYRVEMKDIMTDMGFTCEHFGEGNHDVYFKKPVCNFEMHTGLFSPNHKKEIYDYYINVKKHLIKDSDNQYGYHFSSEDLYIYVTAHEYKHFSTGGTGLRSLVDTYVFIKKFGDKLNFNYIAEETEKLGIREFEQSNRRLALSLFDSKELADEDQQTLDYIIFSGTYGTIENSVKNRLNEFGNNKIKYLMQRLFMPMKDVKTFYPFYYKHKILLPVLFFYRIGKSLTVGRKKTKIELNQLKK